MFEAREYVHTAQNLCWLIVIELDVYVKNQDLPYYEFLESIRTISVTHGLHVDDVDGKYRTNTSNSVSTWSQVSCCSSTPSSFLFARTSASSLNWAKQIVVQRPLRHWQFEKTHL